MHISTSMWECGGPRLMSGILITDTQASLVWESFVSAFLVLNYIWATTPTHVFARVLGTQTLILMLI